MSDGQNPGRFHRDLRCYRRARMLSRRDLLRALPLAPLAGGLLWSAPARAEQLVRIAVGRFKGALTVSGPGLELRGSDGNVLARDRPVVLSATSEGITLAGKRLPYELLRLLGKDELSLRGHRYRRFLEVRWREYRGRPELLVVHPLPLETYVAGIVSSELPHKWPLEAMKVQAVAARTYAVWQKYRRLDLPYHMESTVLDQVYHGAQREHEDAHRAVAETYGMLLVHGRRPARAYFHSSCGGHTESAAEGWGTPLPYLPGSPCGFCDIATRFRWKARVSKKDLDGAFSRLLGEPVEDIRVLSRTKTDRLKAVEVRGRKKKQRITGADLRRLVGYNKIWSTLVTRLDVGAGGLVVDGRGAGHGVGMCQWGARGMVEKGHSFDEALLRYYPGAELRRMY